MIRVITASLTDSFVVSINPKVVYIKGTKILITPTKKGDTKLINHSGESVTILTEYYKQQINLDKLVNRDGGIALFDNVEHTMCSNFKEVSKVVKEFIGANEHCKTFLEEEMTVNMFRVGFI